MSTISFVKIPPSFTKGRGLGGWIYILKKKGQFYTTPYFLYFLTNLCIRVSASWMSARDVA